MNEKSLPQGQLGPCTTRARSTTYFRWHHNTKKTLRNKTQLQSFGWVRLPGFGSLIYLLKIFPSAKVMSLFTIYYCACGGVLGWGCGGRDAQCTPGCAGKSSVFQVFKSTPFFSLRPRPAWLVRIQKAFSWRSPPLLLLEIDPRFCRWVTDGWQQRHPLLALLEPWSLKFSRCFRTRFEVLESLVEQGVQTELHSLGHHVVTVCRCNWGQF